MSMMVSTILTVEDEPDVRAGIRLLLEDEGYDVVEAASYAEAVAVTRSAVRCGDRCGLPPRTTSGRRKR